MSRSGKLRACDDLKHSMTNLARSVETPNHLVSWDYMVQIPQLLSQGWGDWSLFKADHEAGYKQLPIDPADQRFAIVALCHPVTHLWYGFVTRALLFGSVAASLHYNALSRILAALTARCLGIPLVAYFDDFAAIARKAQGGRAIAVFFFAFLHTAGLSTESE